ncbi:MAG: DUF2007 domain-containing protein [Bacteroidetes bacterium]|nr:DUF2007 domain-containing protein [Bacteroidota bacterium]
MTLDWKKVYSSSQLSVASIVAGLLREQDIQANVLNKIDSSYVFLGEVEVYVPANDYEKAITIVNSF